MSDHSELPELHAPAREFDLREVPEAPGQAIVMSRHNGGRWVDLAYLSPQTNAEWFVELLRAGAAEIEEPAEPPRFAAVEAMNRQQRRQAERAAR